MKEKTHTLINERKEHKYGKNFHFMKIMMENVEEKIRKFICKSFSRLLYQCGQYYYFFPFYFLFSLQ